MSNIQFTEDIDPRSEESVTAILELTCAPPGSDGSAPTMDHSDVSVQADGRLRLELESVDSLVPTDDAVEIDPLDVGFEDDWITVSLAASVPTDESAGPTGTNGATSSHNGSAGSSSDGADDEPGRARDERDVPPFRDRELLAEVYESHDRFTDMADAIDMDVTGETVRRYMIEHGIHEPDSYDTGGPEDPEPGAATDAEVEADPEPAESAEASTMVADGIGLPEGVTAETLVRTVKDANTIYEVRRDIGTDREETLKMLRDLDLLDFVVGRLATESEREISREQIIQRLRERAAEQ